MGFFKKSPANDPSLGPVRGGCAKHDMKGPDRPTVRKAGRDAEKHAERMAAQGEDCSRNTYIEAGPRYPKRPRR